uniref:unspecific monooxygenase n=1 Tax=Zygaena filipendulae TaxID=287375 RepID=D2JLJ8_9NEOP|nr:cytochrome P450 CYP332A3 [Zygaena filipendulae]
MVFYTIQWLVLLAFAVFIFIRWLISYRFNYWKRRGVPYIKPDSLLFGNLGFAMKESVFDFFNNLRKTRRDDYFGIYLSWRPALVIQSAELARRILVKDYEYFQDRNVHSGKDDKMGHLNIFTVKNPIWSDMRQHLSPMFTSYRLKLITELMNVNAEQLVQKIERDFVKANKTVNLKDVFTMYTSDTVAYSVFGIRTSALSNERSPLWDNITNHMLNWTYWRGFEFFLIIFMPFWAAIYRARFFSEVASQKIAQMFWDTVNERKKHGKTAYKDLVNHLLMLKENAKIPAGEDAKFADDLMLAQVAVFVFGSVETSSTIASCLLHELAYHPEEQEKLFNEIDQAYKDNDNKTLQYDALNSLNYLTACIFETARRYPPVPFLDRVCNKTYKLNDDVTVEKGTPILLNVLALHHSEEEFSDPEVWRPERVTNTSDNNNMQFHFLPFGDGPRFCIGKRYGLMQIRAGIAQVLHKYRVEPATDSYNIPIDPYSVFTYPKNGCAVKFIPRN